MYGRMHLRPVQPESAAWENSKKKLKINQELRHPQGCQTDMDPHLLDRHGVGFLNLLLMCFWYQVLGTGHLNTCSGYSVCVRLLKV